MCGRGVRVPCRERSRKPKASLFGRGQSLNGRGAKHPAANGAYLIFRSGPWPSTTCGPASQITTGTCKPFMISFKTKQPKPSAPPRGCSSAPPAGCGAKTLAEVAHVTSGQGRRVAKATKRKVTDDPLVSHPFSEAVKTKDWPPYLVVSSKDSKQKMTSERLSNRKGASEQQCGGQDGCQTTVW